MFVYLRACVRACVRVSVCDLVAWRLVPHPHVCTWRRSVVWIMFIASELVTVLGGLVRERVSGVGFCIIKVKSLRRMTQCEILCNRALL